MNCSTQNLQLLLADQLPESLQSQVAEHVAQCEACRQTLQSLSGGGQWWAEVESCYRANGESLQSKTNCQESLDPQDLENMEESFNADFAVGFLEPCDQPQTIGRVGDYEILEVIGRGGMGIVLKGFHRELGRYVALKMMAPHLAASGAARQRFIREARAAAAIVHPHVMPIHAVCTTTRLSYLVMPFVACESLQQRIDRQGPLDLKEVLRIGTQIAAGLAAAHAQGLVHRDIKPANILLEKSVDRVMLTDFGLARAADDASLTRTGILTGTPQYMSPEQARGDAVDARSDLFSLGSVLYTMATGRPPFRAETALGILRRITDTEPRPIREVNPEMPEWLQFIVHRMHDKMPAHRFGSAAEVAELLENCLAHVQQPTIVPLPSILRPHTTAIEHRHAPVIARWAVAIAGVAVLSFSAWRWLNLPERAARDSRITNDTVINPPQSELSDAAVSDAARNFDRELQELESRMSRFWDQVPTAEIQQQPNITQPTNSEDTKP